MARARLHGGTTLMTGNDELTRAATAVADLRRCVAGLQTRFGDTVDVRRLRDDVARLVADLNLLAGEVPATGGAKPAEIVYIPDEDYDPSFWADAEDEGLGARRKA